MAKIIIIGAGPAGCSAAIQLHKAGYEVILLDRETFPRPAPGETLHPGVAPLLQKLDVLAEVDAAAFLRHKGIETWENGIPTYQAYEAEKDWKGYQLYRSSFDAILLQKAIDQGVEFIGEARPKAIKQNENGIVHIQTSTQILSGDFFLDATGKRGWLRQELAIPYQYYSPKRIAYYGYVQVPQNYDGYNPKLIWDDGGWTWLAKVQPQKVAWVRLDLPTFQVRDKDWVPAEVQQFKSFGPRKAVDVSWRIASTLSAQNYFFLGDAAAVLDPASSHGVLKALMSGMMVAHLLQIRQDKQIPLTHLHQYYDRWLRGWFRKEVKTLKEMYNWDCKIINGNF